jgi:hypothetical protein
VSIPATGIGIATNATPSVGIGIVVAIAVIGITNVTGTAPAIVQDMADRFLGMGAASS